MNFAERDYQSIWHPFTQHKNAAMPQGIVRGKGAYLYDDKNNSLLDLVSSWWVNLHGHAHPKIAQAIYDQALQLEHVIFSQFTHEPAVLLAEKLLAILPPAFSKIFYSDNGSTAVEVALKMAYQFWRNQGETQRQRFISFTNGYHGDTFGAMAVGKNSGFFTCFEELFFTVDTFSYPKHWIGNQESATLEKNILQQIEEHLIKYAHQTAAMIIEPLIQGAGGMQMCRPEFLQQLVALMQRYNVLVIFDEVMTGFGRTGEVFACHTANVVPDIICLAKGLTGGFLPLSVTACQERIYAAFLGDNFGQALVHGHSYTANPLGCAAALASLDLLLSVECMQKRHMIEQIHQEMLSLLVAQTSIECPRYCGTIAAFNLPTASDYGSEVSVAWRDVFRERGLLVRPLGNVMYFMPPYCITADELRQAYLITIEELQGVPLC